MLSYNNKVKPKKYNLFIDCFGYLKNYRRETGIYILANEDCIRPGMGVLYERLEIHSKSRIPRTKRLENFHGNSIKHILVIPLKNYFPDRYISDSELRFLETKLITEIKENGAKKNLSNLSCNMKHDLHENQKKALNLLHDQIIKWIAENWKHEFYGNIKYDYSVSNL